MFNIKFGIWETPQSPPKKKEGEKEERTAIVAFL